MSGIGGSDRGMFGLVGVAYVEFFESFRRILKVSHGLVGDIFGCAFVAFPANSINHLVVLAAAFVDETVEDFFNFVLDVVFDLNGSGGWLVTTRMVVGDFGLEEGDMEDRMESTKLLGKGELSGMG